MKKALSRPGLPPIPERIAWPGTLVCVVGRDASSFAATLAGALRERGVPARGLRVELRHAEGAAWEGSPDAILRCHPDALLAELEGARPSDPHSITVGAGLALAAATVPDLLVWIRGEERASSLDPDARAIVREAALVLEDARIETATALADALARTGRLSTERL